MLPTIRSLFFLLALLALPDWAQASHALGGQLTYEALGNNRYRVTCRYFRDCSGIAAENTLTLNCRVGSPVTSCTTNDPRNFSDTLRRGALTPGTPYCPGVPGGPSQCSSNGLTNYQTAIYTGEVTFPPAAAWTLSVEINARPSLANILGNNNLRFEATLNNLVTLPNGQTQVVANTSPQYQLQDVPVPFVCWQQRSTISFSATEPDGDSLVYSLERPLDGCNLPSSYMPQPSAGTRVALGPNRNCYFQVAGSAAPLYSAAFPVSSYALAGTCPTQTGTPYFAFNPQQASFTFAPMMYLPGPSSDGLNKYAVVGKVTEYRRLNGRHYLVGSVRRDILVVVMDCGTNSVPNQPAIQPVAGNPLPPHFATGDSAVVEAQVGTFQELDLRFSDPNTGDQLTVTFTEPTDASYVDLYVDGTTARPFAVQANGTVAPTGKLRLRPSSGTAGRVYRLPLRIEDNACPMKAVQNMVLVVRVARATVTAAGTARGRMPLAAFPNPFTDRVTFSLHIADSRPSAIVITDQLGRVVDELSIPAGTTPGAPLTWQPTADVPAGVYLARSADGSQTVRLLRNSSR